MNPSNSSKARRKKTHGNITPRVINFSTQPISNQSQPIPNQSPPILNEIQQFPQYQTQYYPNQHLSNHQFSNQQNSQQYSASLQQQFSNTPYVSPNSYSQQQFNFSSPQSAQYTNNVTEAIPQYGSQVQDESSEDEQAVFPPFIPPSNNVRAPMAVGPAAAKTPVRPFTLNEDECLARAFVTGSENPKKGRDQTTMVWWDDIAALYNEEAVPQGFGRRDPKQLKNRYNRMKLDVQTYLEAEKAVTATHHTGFNQVLLQEEIEQQFLATNKSNKQRFKCHHVLEIFRLSAKFNCVTTRAPNPNHFSLGSESSPSTPVVGSNGSPNSSQQYHSGDKRSRCSGEEVSSPIKHPARPMGNKAAKGAAKGKAKAGSSSGMSRLEGLELTDDRKYYLDAELTQSREKLKVWQDMVTTNARKIEVDELKCQVRLQQIAAENERAILAMRLTDIDDTEHRDHVKAMQRAILDKWIPKP